MRASAHSTANGFGASGYGLAGARQPCLGFVELEVVEAEPRGGRIGSQCGIGIARSIEMDEKDLATPGTLFREERRRRYESPGTAVARS